MSSPFKGIVFSVALAVGLPSGQLLADDYANGMAALSEKKYAKALPFLTNAIARNQNNAKAFLLRGVAYQGIGELDKALADYDEAIRLDPKKSSAYFVRGKVWDAKGNLDKAIEDFGEAIRLNPNSGPAYAARGAAWRAKGEIDEALADFDTASMAYRDRGVALQAIGEVETALADYDESIRLNPKNSEAYANRGAVWHAKGEYEKALADFDEAIRLDSESLAAFNSRAWLRATCPDAKFRDGAKAIEDANRAGELTDWKDFAVLNTLAAAYAEAGMFNKAVEWQQKAIQVAPHAEMQGCASTLKGYREGKPYRDEPKK